MEELGALSVRIIHIGWTKLKTKGPYEKEEVPLVVYETCLQVY